MKKVLLAGILIALSGLGLMVAETFAAPCPNGAGEYTHNVAECGVNAASSDTETELMPIVKNAINVVIGVVGVVAVVVMIIGGINFIISQGDAAKVQKARNTILYGLVGLVIAVLSFAIVNFVLQGVFKTTTSTPTSHLVIDAKVA